jgi:hypothetical protein
MRANDNSCVPQSVFRAQQGKHLEGLDFRGFWYTDQGPVLLVCGEGLGYVYSVSWLSPKVSPRGQSKQGSRDDPKPQTLPVC